MLTLLQSSPSSWPMFATFGLIMVVMYFFMIRPQRKQQKELEKFRNELKKGDRVITLGGIYGVVDHIKENAVFIKVDENTKLKMSKTALVRDTSDLETK